MVEATPQLHPWSRPEDLDPRGRSVYDAIVGTRGGGGRNVPLTDEEGRLYGPFDAMLADPTVGAPLQELGKALRWNEHLTPRQREQAILEVARAERSGYEWIAHVDAGQRVGLTEAEIGAIEDEKPAAVATADDVVRRTARLLARSGRLDEPVRREAVDVLGPDALGALVYLVGYYRLLALSLRVHGCPTPPGTTFPDWAE